MEKITSKNLILGILKTHYIRETYSGEKRKLVSSKKEERQQIQILNCVAKQDAF